MLISIYDIVLNYVSLGHLIMTCIANISSWALGTVVHSIRVTSELLVNLSEYYQQL